MSPQVAVRTPGKVNLQLSVGPVGADGYHPIATIFQAVDLHEVVVAQPRTDGHITLTVEAAPGAAIALDSVPVDETNLAWRAAELVAREYGIADGVDLAILKGVPVAGGMAGGSADAAAALIACAEAWEVGAPRAELVELASRLGADVPFACMGHTAVGLGRGERLSPAMTHGTFHWVFATQATGLSTPEVYGTFDAQVEAGERSAATPVISDTVMTALMSGDPAALGAALTNDLQDAALELAPHLADTIDAAMDAEACGAIVSGSGPTVAALARSSQHALSIAARIRASGTAHAVVVASGPVAGATVLA